MSEDIDFGEWGKMSEEILQKQFPLHRACRDGDLDTVTILLVSDGPDGGRNDIYVEDIFYGWTPAHWAAYFGKLPCLMKLIELGYLIDYPTHRFQQTPAHLAAFGGTTHCLKWLLHCGAMFNKQDYLGETPLHKAARTGNLECLSLLISHGGDTSVKNHNGHTPGELALICGHSSFARCLHDNQSRHNVISHEPTCISNGLNSGHLPSGVSNGHLHHSNGGDSYMFHPTGIHGTGDHANGFQGTETFHGVNGMFENGDGFHGNGTDVEMEDDMEITTCDIRNYEDGIFPSMVSHQVSNSVPGDNFNGVAPPSDRISSNGLCKPLSGRKRSSTNLEAENNLKRVCKNGVTGSEFHSITPCKLKALGIPTSSLSDHQAFVSAINSYENSVHESFFMIDK